MKSRNHKKIKGFSLVEMLITIVIISSVLLVTSLTLITMIKASAISSSRTNARSEGEFVANLISRNLKNARAEQISVFRVSGRTIDGEGNIVDLGTIGTDTPLPPGSSTYGNEIWVRPVGYEKNVCIALIPATNGDSATSNAKAYLVKTVSTVDLTGKSCFDSASNPDFKRYLTYLNSDEVTFESDSNDPTKGFRIRYYQMPSENYVFEIEMSILPTYWIGGERSPYRSYAKKFIVSTDKLTL